MGPRHCYTLVLHATFFSAPGRETETRVTYIKIMCLYILSPSKFIMRICKGRPGACRPLPVGTYDFQYDFLPVTALIMESSLKRL